MCTKNHDHMVYSSWCMGATHNFLSFWVIFCPFIPLTNQKAKILKKYKKTREILSFYICLPQMTIIWFKVPEIWSTTGKVFSHFGPFFVLLLKNQNFEKKRKPGVIILPLCTTNDNHMMLYGSLDISCNGQGYLGSIFCPFDPPLKIWKIKILIKWKKNSWRYYHLYHKCINENHDVWFPRYGVWQTEFFLTLDHFLPFYSPNNPKNHNFDKVKKTTREIIILYKCTINENYMMYIFWDMKHDRPFCSFWPFCALLPH